MMEREENMAANLWLVNKVAQGEVTEAEWIR